jgi:hypothetical protein
MTIVAAFKSGVERVGRAPLVLAGVFLLTFLFALPLGLALRPMLVASLGADAHAAAAGTNYAWWQQFSDQASGVGPTLSPAIIGFAAVLSNVSAVLDNRSHVVPVAAAGAAYALLWIFLAGGIIDRYARNRPVRGAAFFAACGVYFFRFLRLGVVAAIAYVVLFAYVHPLLLSGAYEALTSNLTEEWKAFFVRVVLYLVFGVLLSGVNIVCDYAKVRAVVEDRRSMLGALVAAVAFLRRRPAAFGLYALDGVVFVGLLVAYALVSPGATASAWWALMVGQIYLLGRLWVRLTFVGSEIAFFQGALAHAGYVSAPFQAWPDSPAADAIGPSAPGADNRGTH